MSTSLSRIWAASRRRIRLSAQG
ncbi:hypothetical protein [Pectobacterium colocasium]